MLLNSVTKHVKEQNWFAVFVDFFIVVVGILIAFQITNWNETGQERISEAQYLDRFANELEVTISHILEERTFSEESRGVIKQFTTQLYSDAVSDQVLFSATKDYITKGTFFADFAPMRSTFDDLITTGSFDKIENEAIRKKLIKLHANYERAEKIIAYNILWLQQGEARIYYDFDAFRFDERTKTLFEDADWQNTVQEIRKNRAILRRHAAFHYWLKVRSIELYDELEPQAKNVLELIQAERGQ